jgi:hypothetical protein
VFGCTAVANHNGRPLKNLGHMRRAVARAIGRGLPSSVPARGMRASPHRATAMSSAKRPPTNWERLLRAGGGGGGGGGGGAAAGGGAANTAAPLKVEERQLARLVRCGRERERVERRPRCRSNCWALLHRGAGIARPRLLRRRGARATPAPRAHAPTRPPPPLRLAPASGRATEASRSCGSPRPAPRRGGSSPRPSTRRRGARGTSGTSASCGPTRSRCGCGAAGGRGRGA